MTDVRIDWKDGDTIESWDAMVDWVYDNFGNITIESTAEYAIFSFPNDEQAMLFTLKWL